jgi:hypothetical protein
MSQMLVRYNSRAGAYGAVQSAVAEDHAGLAWLRSARCRWQHKIRVTSCSHTHIKSNLALARLAW